MDIENFDATTPNMEKPEDEEVYENHACFDNARSEAVGLAHVVVSTILSDQ